MDKFTFTEIVVDAVKKLDGDSILRVNRIKQSIELYSDSYIVNKDREILEGELVEIHVGAISDAIRMRAHPHAVKITFALINPETENLDLLYHDVYCGDFESHVRDLEKYSVQKIEHSTYRVSQYETSSDSFFVTKEELLDNPRTKLYMFIDGREFASFKNLSIFVSNENTKTI